jgi:hypothetical protein
MLRNCLFFVSIYSAFLCLGHPTYASLEAFENTGNPPTITGGLIRNGKNYFLAKDLNYDEYERLSIWGRVDGIVVKAEHLPTCFNVGTSTPLCTVPYQSFLINLFDERLVPPKINLIGESSGPLVIVSQRPAAPRKRDMEKYPLIDLSDLT